jgi:hypothetical protein
MKWNICKSIHCSELALRLLYLRSVPVAALAGGDGFNDSGTIFLYIWVQFQWDGLGNKNIQLLKAGGTL